MATTYGSSVQVPVFAVDVKGRITSVTNTSINFGTATVANATKVGTISTATNASFYPTFVDTNNTFTTYEFLYTDSGISYNPSTDLLTVGKIKPTQIQDSSGGTGANNFVLTANGSGGWSWASVTGGGSPAISGISVQQGGSPVGTAGGITTLNFSGATVTASTSTATITISASPNVTVTQTGYTCTNPITVTGGNTINIASSSNAYGRKFVSTTDPALSGTICNGDIWYDTTGTTDSSGFASGTKLLFYQATSPTGWTQVTTQNNKALRVVSGSGGGSGGSTAFTSVFTSRTPSGSVSGGSVSVSVSGNTGGWTLSTSEIPSHTHGYGIVGFGGGLQSGSNFTGNFRTTTESTGGSGSHSHSVSASGSGSVTGASFGGNAMDFAVQYIDVIIASKD